MGKLCCEVRERHYDLVVVDAPATGHIVGQLAAPQAINDLVKVGPDPHPDRLDARHPLRPAPDRPGRRVHARGDAGQRDHRAGRRVREETTVRTGGRGGQPGAARAVRPARGGGLRAAALRAVDRRSSRPAPGGDVAPVLEAARLAVTLRRTRAAHLERLRGRARPATCPCCYLPYLFTRARGAHHPPGGRLARRGARAAERRPAGRRARPTTVARGLLAAKEIVVACGPGGVGKTTTAAAAAAMAAVEHGGKVLVLTVDPARRLADALGLEGIGNDELRIPDEAFAGAAASPRGELWAAMLDTKETWDDLIRAHAPDAADARQILANPLYQNISGRFVQSHDYIAMERLYEIHSEGDYDLIVVDTPPTRNALDFLDAPQRMADFFSSRLLRWLIVPYRSRLVNVASRPFYQVADRILGTQFLADISEFFILFQTMYARLRRAGRGRQPAAVGPAHHVHGGLHPRGGAAARGRVLLGRAHGARAAPRCDRAQQGAAAVPARPRRRQAGPVHGAPRRRSWPRA